jgi:hypothetical protein
VDPDPDPDPQHCLAEPAVILRHAVTHKLDQLVGFGGAGQPRSARTVAAEQGERRQPDFCPGVAETRLNERIRIGEAGAVGNSLAMKIRNLKFNPEISAS